MTDRERKLSEVLELSCGLLDEQLDPVGVARLETLLYGDPEACEVYLNLTTLHAHLDRELGGAARPVLPPSLAIPHRAPVQAGEASEAPMPAQHAEPFLSPKAIRWRLPVRLAIAASLLLAVGLAVLLSLARIPQPSAQLVPANHSADAAIATLVEARGVTWSPDAHAFKVGDHFPPSTVALSKGTVVIRFDNGAIATLSGPAELVVENHKSAELRSGRVLVRCEQEAVGFTLRTSASDYIDLGTEFGVSINADSSSEVHVFEGVVVARPRASDLVVPVLRNEAGRVEPERGDLIAIEASADKFPGVQTARLATRPAAVPSTTPPGPLPADARVVFIGDHATDLETHLLLLNQAFGRIFPDGPRPRLLNAGITLPLDFDNASFDRLVAADRPTHAVIEFGPEIAASPNRRTVAEFETEIRRLVDRLKAVGVEPIIATGFRLGQRQAQCQGILDDYNRSLRKVALEKNCRLADVDAHFLELDRYRLSLVVPNGAVPTFSGSREMTSVLLATMGYPGVRVDQTLQVSLLPGTITRWHYRLKPGNQPLSAGDVQKLSTADPAKLLTDEGWDELFLPQPEDKFCSRVPDPTHSAMNRDRARGFAINLFHDPAMAVEAVAIVQSRDEKPAYVNIGADVQALWLNGEKVYQAPARWTGWHAGKERIAVRLRAGQNRLVLEAGSSFFVSVTTDRDAMIGGGDLQ